MFWQPQPALAWFSSYGSSVPTMTLTTQNLFHQNNHVVTLTATHCCQLPNRFTVQTHTSKHDNPFLTNIVKLEYHNCFAKSAVKIVLFCSFSSWPHHTSSPVIQGASLSPASQLQVYSWWVGICDWLAKSLCWTLCNREGNLDGHHNV